MSMHTPPELLARFVDGDLDEDVAVAVALHLDACPRCATRAASLEPLATAFAAAEDPPVPAGLADAIVEQARRLPPPDPVQSGLQVSAGLLVVAVGLLLGLGDPAGLLAEGAATLEAAATATLALASWAQESVGPALLLGVVGWLAVAGVAWRALSRLGSPRRALRGTA